ncbi:D123-domain-containing protein [Tilletiaria anomala UBC 951]|uniref:D123-domain-containing protein n=1 Tax=Tilletiaria anomala (strain ATCC 24038 / CBS 436.72 / UBC 951) TaxID=1037660 RepID=A0A066VH98_TILAU|nr:D123-domain-containing protein [Tilletiaria anomala UBC 951]KDN38139.1 D123-domain-containing protein [Tilletiaria anomala UBC 951]
MLTAIASMPVQAGESSRSVLPSLTPIDKALELTSFQSWYPLFKKVSPKATVLSLDELEPDFLDWLEEDGLTLPEGSEGPSVPHASIEGVTDKMVDSETETSDSEESEAEASDRGGGVPRRFVALDERIRQVMARYDGRIFPKLNWSAPRDAAWILPGSNLQCTTPADVYLLLKSSDFVANDVAQARELLLSDNTASTTTSQSPPGELLTKSVQIGHAVPPRPSLYLVLKKWFDMPSSAEFRCFVRAGRFVAISQRDENYYEHLQPSHVRQRAIKALHSFWLDYLHRKEFEPKELRASSGEGDPTPAPAPPPAASKRYELNDYVFDAYITRDMSKVFLVDINPYLPRTDALLWDWEELEDLAAGKPIRLKPDGVHEKGTGDDSGTSTSDESSDDEEFETVLRVYTDGKRAPEEIRRPLSEAERLRKRLPKLRVITSHAQAQQAASGAVPKYARNMVPQDVIDASDGQSIAEFAHEWGNRLGEAMKG